MNNNIFFIFLILVLTSTATIGQDLTTATYEQRLSIIYQDTNAEGLAFDKDGSQAFVIGRTGRISIFSLSTPFDLSTAAYVSNVSVAAQDNYTTEIRFNADGTKLFMVGRASDHVNEYNLSAPYDLGGITFSQRLSVKSQESNPTGLAFNTAGTKLYIIGLAGDAVNEYDLATAFDISTATFKQRLSVANRELSPTSIALNHTGSKMYVLGNANDKIYEYTLSAAWDISSATFVSEFSVKDQENKPTGLWLNNDGQLFIVGKGKYAISKFKLQTSGSSDPDNDGDGTPASQDCNDTDANLTVAGAACDDGNATTSNDIVTANCTCEGTINDPDNDGDGTPASQDCNDADANLTITGASCDDGNAATSNDKVTANCTCEGTINDPDNDGDGVVASQDCNDADANLTTVGASCDDGNAATTNDIVTANCTCQGTPNTTTASSLWTDHTNHISINKKVLIGDGENLADGYSLYVAEGILAEKLKLALTTTWPDYVFEEDYNLTSLQEVADHLKKNKHLPNVPSAKEVEEKGVDMVEMNAVLLRQIEELWLHLIEMKKENEELRDMIKK